MTSRATTTTLLSMVRLLTRDNSSDLSSANILSIANHELHGSLVPTVAAMNEQYFRYTTAFTGDGTTSSWTIPTRAFANRVVAAFILNTSGYEYPTTIGNKSDMRARLTGSTNSSDRPFFWIHDNKLVAQKPLTSGFTLSVDTFMRPGDLIETSSAAQVVTVNASSLVLNAASPVAAGVPFDIVSNSSPFRHLGIDQTATLSTTTITDDTLNFTPPTGVSVGDWVCAAESSPIPQIPYECHPALYELVTGRIYALLGDQAAAQLHVQTASDIMQAVVPMLSPRVVDQTDKVLDNEGVAVPVDAFFALES